MFSPNFHKHFSMANVVFCTIFATYSYLINSESSLFLVFGGLAGINIWSCFYHARREVILDLTKEKD